MISMAHVAFDTLKFVESLIVAGMPAEQAKALSNAQKVVFEEALDGVLATKADVYEVKTELKADIQELRTETKVEMAEVKAEIRVLKWMMGFLLTGMCALILKAFF